MSSTPPGEAPFTPRKEFIKDQTNQPSAFALLALSGANCIRLYSFAPVLIASLTRLFETHRILSFREDAENNMCEFALDGKPWANPKAEPSEKLLVDIVAIIYQCGYTYLSTIDYGREQDDRLVLTFARPAPPNFSRTPTPIAQSAPLPHDRSSGSSSGLAEKLRSKRIPFALSFSSVTVMRVISPPLHLTPAILQAVRASWPRGVVSEKKVGENSFEFKLKGYKWFQQDTFATDSLRHILSLLTSLDTHSFTLLASLSLTNRSRVKDLWVFTGPSPEIPSESTSLEVPQGHVMSAPATAATFGDVGLGPWTQQLHQRLATDPSPAASYSPSPPLFRSASDAQRRRLVPSQPHVLRKPAPRAQVPVSVVQDSDVPDEMPILRVNLPSTISTGVENMTGVGASPNVIYSTSPFDNINRGSPLPSPRPRIGSLDHGRPPLRPVSDRVKTPPLLTSSVPPSPQKATYPQYGSPNTTPPNTQRGSMPMLPPLLGLDTFRDSGMSGSSDFSREIPIKWSGPFKEEFQLQQQERSAARRNRVSSSGPQFPGGWRPSPIVERSEGEFVQGPLTGEKKATTPIHEMLSRIESPEVVRPEMSTKKSEAALVEIIQSTTPAPPPLPQRQNSQRREPTSGAPNGGQGWVLVNVENSVNAATPLTATPVQPEITQPADIGAVPVATPSMKSSSHSGASRPSPLSLDPSPSPAAKAIVILDAMDSRHKKSRSTANAKESRQGTLGLKRFFSLSKKNSQKTMGDDDEKPRKVYERSDTGNSIPRSNLRDKLRLIGTPEASRREDKRRSVD
ncbi:hypothetical protein HYPSUDRAFT_199376 [Hypholoma sublateritium FD-334 SS-4]|uniref:Uncharacterized protein n=1 Tax=Hypholoma sublateritium (strain FD-334 SS-4) TaxID=945553 RepID=A0A0D2PCB9_HYPSF|nr:hypothetical protein HYPSUDRAFT_199376 [Hypholoma sublateritium FD-334 SS-4]